LTDTLNDSATQFLRQYDDRKCYFWVFQYVSQSKMTPFWFSVLRKHAENILSFHSKIAFAVSGKNL